MTEIASDDLVLPFRLGRVATRGRLVRLGPAVDQMLSQHDYPAPVSQLLGELLALGAVLSSTLKYDGFFTLQTRSEGAVRLMVADITSSGEMRGYANIDADAYAEAVAQAAGESPSVPRLLGGGHLAFTVDQGPDMERYQAIVALEGESLAACAHNYFQQSEQIDTGIMLTCDQVGGNWRAGALMLQRMPTDGGNAEDEEGFGMAMDMPGDTDGDDEDWHRAIILMSSVTPAEMLDPTLPATDLAYRLFHEEHVRGYSAREMRFGCRCSRARITRTLQGLPQAEMSDMLEDGKIEVRCQFCNSSETFDEQALDVLFTA